YEQKMVEVNDAQNTGSNMGDEQAQEMEQKTPIKGNERNKEIAEVLSQASQGSTTTKKRVEKEAVTENALIVW
ncbi:hypothetical protein HAX54_037657, partial [Datura stramonium]|nr:hypothetical protein [Datura stramonium]